MGAVEYPIREPTGRAWVVLLAATVTAGELYYERSKDFPAFLFNRQFSDGELLALIAPLLVVALLSAAHLARLYLAPGHLRLDTAAGVLSRSVRTLTGTRAHDAPLASWRVRVHFYSQSERDRGVWKRLVLVSPAGEEVLLWTDVTRGEDLLALLRTASPALALEEHVDRP